MPPTLVIAQILNGVQLGLMLFLLASGLTLIFGIMDMVNLAHGSLYMFGAYFTASVTSASGSFWVGVLAGAIGTAIVAAVLEVAIMRRLYRRDHLSQVLATFAIILISNEVVRFIWGAQPVQLNTPEAFRGPLEIPLWGEETLRYPAYRLLLIGMGVAIALILFLIVNRTKVGMWVRAGASNREMAMAMGVPIRLLFTAIFALGAALSAIAGGLTGPLLAVEIGMGENILILTFLVIVIGGIGSIKGALVASLLVGIVDTAGRVLIPLAMRQLEFGQFGTNMGGALASMLIYLIMAVILFWKPEGLFPARS
ncbi:MAG: branched-chain amino acid ABC transporter permease [Chloroflexota bacterium]